MSVTEASASTRPRSQVVQFRLVKETKGAGKYNEIAQGVLLNPFSDDAAIGTLYVRKAALGRLGYPVSCPPNLIVTIEVG